MNESSNRWYAGCFQRGRQVVAVSLGALLAVQTAGLTAAAQEPAQQPAAPQSQSPDQDPGRIIASARTSADDLPSAPEPQIALQQQQAKQPAQPEQLAQDQQPVQQQQPAPQQNAPQQPVGTAAAPYEKPTGVPGSRPAGAVIAPAKQKRVRSIVIRVGLLLAGGAAIGTVVGLSRASHSQP